MKNKFLNAPIIFCSLAVFFIMFSGCNVTDPQNSLGLILASKKRENPIAVNITDSDGRNIPSVTVSFAGKDSSKVINEVNKSITSITTKNGNVIFAIKDSTDISASNPVVLILHLQSTGYEVADFPVRITKKGFQRFYFKLVKSASISGVGIERWNFPPTTELFDQITGILNNPITLTTPGGVIVFVPSGISMKDDLGNLLSGTITVTITAYLGNGTAAGSPGKLGLFPFPTITEGGTTLAAIAGISVQFSDQGGRIAQTFIGGIPTVSLPIAGNTNPFTQTAFTPGTSLSAYGTGLSGSPTLLGNGNVGPKPTEPTSTPYYINSNVFPPGQLANGFSWYYWPVNFRQLTFDFGTFVNSWGNLEIVISNRYAAQQVYALGTERTQSFPVYDTPSEAFVRIAASNTLVTDKIIPVEGLLNQLFVKGTSTFPGYTAHFFDVFVQGKCPDEDPANPSRINPNLFVSVTNTGGYPCGQISLYNGRGSIYLPDGTYNVGIDFNGETYATSIMVSGETMNISSNLAIEPMPNKPWGPYIWYYFLTYDACQ